MFQGSLIKFMVSLVVTILVFPLAFVEASTTYKVKASDNLSKIINTYYKDSHLNKSQVMIGLLAENPKAFRRGNVNALKRNQLLSLPDSANLKVMDEKQASKLIVQHHKNFHNRIKKTMSPPFEAYSSSADDVNTLIMVQQQKISELKKLEAERAELLARVEKLIADKEQVDTELKQLESNVEK